MTAIYIAARFSRRPEAHELSKRLRERGHTITSRWVRPGDDHVVPTGLSAQAADAERTRFATEDCDDVTACECMISLMEEPRSNGRGGRHVEYGMALGLGKRLVIIGPRETVFHHLPQVEHFETTDDLLRALDDGLSLEPDRAKADQFYIVWNGARTEGFVTDDESDAIAAVTGQPHYDLGMPSQSTIGEAFHEAYGDDPVTLEEITLIVDRVRNDAAAFDGEAE